MTTTSAKRRTKPPKEVPTDRAAKPPRAVRATIAGPVLDLPTHSIEASGFNPRVRFDDASLERLAASLREVGLIEPIVVWRRDASGAWLVIAGGSLGIKLQSWRPDEAWLDLHTVDELEAIARKWKVADRVKSEPGTPTGSKAERIASILAGVAGQAIKVPREILRAKLGR